MILCTLENNATRARLLALRNDESHAGQDTARRFILNVLVERFVEDSLKHYRAVFSRLSPRASFQREKTAPDVRKANATVVDRAHTYYISQYKNTVENIV